MKIKDKILIIEDEKLLADSLKAMLEKKGFDVEAVYDGESGAEYAEHAEYANAEHAESGFQSNPHAAVPAGNCYRTGEKEIQDDFWLGCVVAYGNDLQSADVCTQCPAVWLPYIQCPQI